MRVRVVTNPPLPVLKAWFSLQPLPATATVSEFKDKLCAGIRILHGLKRNDITLLLDDFQLLDEGPIDVVRDGDLIYVDKVAFSGQSLRSAEVTSTSKKRKRADSIPCASTPRILPDQTQDKGPSSGSGSDSDSDDSTSDGTSSESSSSESSSSDSDSDSASPPTLASSKAPQALSKSNPPTTIFIPPGQGKQTTRSRNLRRRRKHQYDRFAAKEDPTNQAAGVNAIPLGKSSPPACGSAAVEEPTPPPVTNGTHEFAMASLSNKNKKRGFKNGIGQSVPAKIVFTQEKDVGAVSAKKEDVPSTAVARLIPPSEKQEAGLLPDNMFITRVVLEHSKKKRTKARIMNDHKGDQKASAPCTQSDEICGLDFNAIEHQWETLAQIKERVNLPSGTLVGWKALGINPITITPEVLLHAAMILKFDDNNVFVRPLTPTGPWSLDTDPEETEEYTWDDIISGQWKMISISASIANV